MSARIIKKYPNRRLYDTELSKYITLGDLRQFVYDGGDFQVIDANSEEDITRTILLQIITEQEAGGEPLFTSEILMQMIRFYGGAAQNMFTDYLHQSLELFSKQQEMMQKPFNDLVGNNPVSAMTELTRKNMEMWQNMQQEFLAASPFASSTGKSATSDRTQKKTTGRKSEK